MLVSSSPGRLYWLGWNRCRMIPPHTFGINVLIDAYRLRELLPLRADDPLLRLEPDELRELEPLLREEEPLYDRLLDELDEPVLRERLEDTPLDDLVLLDDLLLVVGRDMLLVLRDELDVDCDVDGAFDTELRDRDVRVLLVRAVLFDVLELTGRLVIVLREVPVERRVLTVPLFSVLPVLRRVISRDDARAVDPVRVLRTRDAVAERALLGVIAVVFERSILLLDTVDPRWMEVAERAEAVRDVPETVRPLLIERADVASLFPTRLDLPSAMAYLPLRALPLVTEDLRDAYASRELRPPTTPRDERAAREAVRRVLTPNPARRSGLL